MATCRLEAAMPLRAKTFSDAAFLGKLVQLSRQSLESRLLSVRFAHRFAADMGRATMRELRQLRTCFNQKTEERYLAMRDLFGGAVPTPSRRVFGEGFQEEIRDILQVQGKDLRHAIVLFRRSR